MQQITITLRELDDQRELRVAATELGGDGSDGVDGGEVGVELLPGGKGCGRTIVDAAVDGTLTAERLDDLIAEAAHTQMRATYTGELRRRTERMFVGAFFEALQSGAADEILEGLRLAFDTAAEAIAQARALRA
jgi:hypothetical protein